MRGLRFHWSAMAIDDDSARRETLVVESWQRSRSQRDLGVWITCEEYW